jgi:protease I
MTNTLESHRVAILAADGVERVELEEPRRALEDAGAATELLSEP